MDVDEDADGDAASITGVEPSIGGVASIAAPLPSCKSVADRSKLFDVLDAFTRSIDTVPPRDHTVFVIMMAYSKWVSDLTAPCSIDIALKKFHLHVVSDGDSETLGRGAHVGDILFTSSSDANGHPLLNERALHVSFISECRIMHTAVTMATKCGMTNTSTFSLVDPGLNNKLSRAYHSMKYCHDMVRNYARMRVFVDEESFTRSGASASSWGTAMSGTRLDYQDLSQTSDYMKTFLFCARYMQENNLRVHLNFVHSPHVIDACVPVMDRHGRSPLCEVCGKPMHRHLTRIGKRCDHAFKMMYEPLPSTKRVVTRSWQRYDIGLGEREVPKLEDFIRFVCDKDVSWQAFNWLNRKSGTCREAAQYLATMRHVECPRLSDMMEDLSLSTRSGVIRYEEMNVCGYERLMPKFYPYGAVREAMGLPHGDTAETLPDNFASSHFIDCWFHPQDLHDMLRGKRMSRRRAKKLARPDAYAYENYVENRVCKKCGVRCDAHYMRGVKMRCNCYHPSKFEDPDTWELRCANCNKTGEACRCSSGFVGYVHKIGAAMSIETPLTDQIFKAQGMTEEAIMWLWIMIGRLFAPAHKHDGWGTGLMIWGFAGEWHLRTLTTIETINHTNHNNQNTTITTTNNTGTGKSTLADLISMLFQEDDIANIQNQSEDKFGLSAALTRSNIMTRLILLREMKEDCNLPQASVQSICSGESITIAKKHTDPVKIPQPRCHMVTIGNCIPRLWLTGTTAIVRRFPPVRMSEPVPQHHRDPALKKRIIQRGELVLWWLKCTMLYFEFTLPYLYGTREIWTGLPSYYHETSKLLRAATNVIYCFLTKASGIRETDSEGVSWVLKFSPDKYMSLMDFTSTCRNWAKKVGKRMPTLSPDNYEGAFGTFKLRVREKRMRDPRKSDMLTTEWVCGIGWEVCGDDDATEADAVAETEAASAAGAESGVEDAGGAADAPINPESLSDFELRLQALLEAEGGAPQDGAFMDSVADILLRHAPDELLERLRA